MKKVFLTTMASLLFFLAQAQSQFTLSGYLTDASNGESLIGATVYIDEIKGGTVSNVYGYYAITLPAGSYNIRYQYIGYEDKLQQVNLTEDSKVNVEFAAQDQELEAVVVTAEAEDMNVSSIEMST
ncbi:MAG: hypothetical protein ACI92W_000722, partial [Paraglaciecola sp.]